MPPHRTRIRRTRAAALRAMLIGASIVALGSLDERAYAAPTATASPTPASSAARQGLDPTSTPTPSATALASSPTPTATATAESRRRAARPTATPTPSPVLDEPGTENLDELEEIAADASEDEAAEEPEVWTRPARPPLYGRTADGLSLHVLRYLAIAEWAAAVEGVDPAVLAALMEVEGSGEDAVSHAGALGLMQLMPDKLFEDDDPFDPATNVLRAAQLVRRLTRAWDGDLAAVAGAYFGAIDAQGRVTYATDGIVDGLEYVTRFAAAYQRWSAALGVPEQPVIIRMAPRPRAITAPESQLDGAELSSKEAAPPKIPSSPERDRWYLQMDRAHPALLPLLY